MAGSGNPGPRAELVTSELVCRPKPLEDVSRELGMVGRCARAVGRYTNGAAAGAWSPMVANCGTLGCGRTARH